MGGSLVSGWVGGMGESLVSGWVGGHGWVGGNEANPHATKFIASEGMFEEQLRRLHCILRGYLLIIFLRLKDEKVDV